MKAHWLSIVALAQLAGQDPVKLTLAEAEAIALRHHPRIAAAQFTQQAAGESVHQTRAALRPVVAANATGSVAEHGTRLGAGALNASSLFSRTATGINITQTLFDFGRARSLTAAAQSRASAMEQNTASVRAEILLRIREAYYRALQAEARSRVGIETLEARRTTLKQISALAASNLRSTLDLSFAELGVSEAELFLNRAGNERLAADVQLSAALGYSDLRRFAVADQPDPEPLAETVAPLIEQAIRSRPELSALRFDLAAARHAAENERRQMLPQVTATGVGGVFGFRDERLQPHYGALGVNVNFPLFNGRLFDSRRKEATFRAEAAAQSLRDAEIRVARDVRMAWIDARNALEQLTLTAKILAQAAKTLRLAQSRYELGLSAIVELSQAQLARTNAEVDTAAARYDYLIRCAFLAFQTGDTQ